MGQQPSPYRLSRRAFLAALPLAAGVAACRRRPYRRDDFVVPDRSSMAILPAPDYNVDLSGPHL